MSLAHLGFLIALGARVDELDTDDLPFTIKVHMAYPAALWTRLDR